jgi:two-component system, OmpR family, heavy metal sensor histidine kinase CusS
MRSIRLSLTLYFLGLLAAALGTACLLVYRIAGQTLEARRKAAEELIDTQYNDHCRAEKARLDARLASQADILARLTQFHFNFSRAGDPTLPALGVLSTALAPSGYLLVPTWAGQGVWSGPRDTPFAAPYASEMHRRSIPTEIKLNTSDLLREVDGQVAEYFQIEGRNSTYPSQSLAGRSFLPPRDITTFAPDQWVHWEADDARLDANTLVRRVTFKVSVARWGPPPDMRRPGPPSERDRSARPERPRPTILVQCAYDLHKRDAVLAEFAEQRSRELADLGEDTRDSLARLRGRLLWLGLATFAATVLGCYFLVRLGLVPLRRLSDAVSRVSPRDFHLPVDETRLPRELRPIAERLAETLEQLGRAFAREKQATADMSHELRTPLAALLATTELALRKPREAEDYREFLAECRRSAKQMNEVVERLLALARLDAGVDRLRVREVDAAMLAEQAAAMVRPLATARGLRLGVHLPDDPAAVHVAADPDKVREVLTNLLHNAIQYNTPGGSVDVAVERDNGSLVLEVRDTGIGIAPTAREHIFERFWRADPSRGHDGLHAGLGLAIVKEYVGLMGGAITVDSAEGKGSTFRIRLPVGGPAA